MGETRMGNRAFGVFRSNFHGQERGLTNEPPPDSRPPISGELRLLFFLTAEPFEVSRSGRNFNCTKVALKNKQGKFKNYPLKPRDVSY